MYLGKKGISTVVETMLLILLTVGAVFVVAGYVIPFVRNNLNSSTQCLPYKDYFKFQENIYYQGNTYKYNCFDNNGLYGITVQAQGNDQTKNEDVKGFYLVFEQGATRKRVDIINNTLANNMIEGVRMLNNSETNIMIPNDGETRTYVYNSGNVEYQSVELYSLLSSGKACELTDSITLTKCDDSLQLSIS